MSLSQESLLDLHSLRHHLSSMMNRTDETFTRLFFGMLIDMIDCIVNREGERDAVDQLEAEREVLEDKLKGHSGADMLRAIGADPNDKDRVAVTMCALYAYKRQRERRGSE